MLPDMYPYLTGLVGNTLTESGIRLTAPFTFPTGTHTDLVSGAAGLSNLKQ